MKQNGRADRSAKERSDSIKFREEAHSAEKDNKTSRAEQTLNKSNKMKLKVFIADDSIEIRNRVKEMLKENKSIDLLGESGDAEQAITALRNLKPDVVILDIHMPGGGGMRVLKDIKMLEPDTIAIVFTAFPYAQYRQAYLSPGANYFFDKTTEVQKLADVLAELAEKHFIR